MKLSCNYKYNISNEKINELFDNSLHMQKHLVFYNNKNNKSLSSQVHTLKGLYFMSTKKSVFDVLLASTATSSQSRNRFNQFGSYNNNKPRIVINRIK